MAPEPRIILVAYPGAQSLDVTGPAEVFAHAARVPGAPRYQVVLASRGGGAITTSSGLALVTAPLARLRPRRADTVLVAGGSEAGVTAAVDDARLAAWLRRAAAGAGRIGSVCSGAFVLAAAGVLDGRTVATHWAAAARLARFRPALTVNADAIFVRDGRVWTSAGITTGIDMALAIVEEDAGTRVADGVAAELVLHARRPGFQSQYSDLLAAQARRDDPLGGVVAWASDHLAALDVEALAGRAGVSVRTLHRLCARALGTTPAKLIERLRTDRARVLLATTDYALKEIAAPCGFRDGAQLTRSFSRRFGVSPRGYRLLRGAPADPATRRARRAAPARRRARRASARASAA